MKRIFMFSIGLFLAAFLGFWGGCATEMETLKVEKSLPQSKLAYYNDSFDTMRDDLWDKAGYVFSDTQLANIKIADMTIEDGRLRIDTKTGGFSKGGLVSKFSFRGDFDVQTDFQIDFVAGISDMDQFSILAAIEKTKSGKPTRVFIIGLGKRGKNKINTIYSGYLEEGKAHTCYWHPVDDFTGSLRFLRTGDEVSTFYRRQGRSRWKKMCTLPSAQNDISIQFVLFNFSMDRNSITASRSIGVWIDNFTINAAQEIIENEI
jgi:hypothetical protein